MTEDPEQAVGFYRKGAEKGDISAMLSLGVSCWKGEGTSRDLVQSLKWLNIAYLYSQRSSSAQLKWRARATIDEVQKQASLEEINMAGRLAQEWEEAHRDGR